MYRTLPRRSRIKPTRTLALGCLSAAVLAICAEPAAADWWSRRAPSWGPGELVLTGGGCPIETPDALSLMFASGRPGGAGDLDIWVIDRPAVDGAWGAAKNLPGPVNSSAADFCPAPLDRTLFFVSSRAHPEACGGSDIYMTRQSPAGDWAEPVHLPCAPVGPNTAGMERSPSFVEAWYGTFLFYSTAGPGGDDDIHVSIMDFDGNLGQGIVVKELSTAGNHDQMPTVRARGDGGFEVTFNSNRPGTAANPVFGGQDVYWAQSSFLPFWWSAPRNAGSGVNTAADETRASLSADLQRLYVGRGNIFVSQRQ